MNFLHTMVRTSDLSESLRLYVDTLGLVVAEDKYNETFKCRTILLVASGDALPFNKPVRPALELVHYSADQAHRNNEGFGHVAYSVGNIYASCKSLLDAGYEILRPPRDGYLAYIRSPEGVAIELVQAKSSLAPEEPWQSMPDTGEW